MKRIHFRTIGRTTSFLPLGVDDYSLQPTVP
jgi:hypothetical protein